MAFNGYEFIFDGVPGGKYDLLLYNFGGNKQSEDVSFPSAGKVIEDRISRSPTSIFYGIEKSEPLTFPLVLVASPDRMESNRPYDRFDVEVIASWLTGHQEYKWLKIEQPDLDHARYKCVITELKQISIGGGMWGFSCTVTCDSPYAYHSTRETKFVCGSAPADIVFRNRSSANDKYYPVVEIDLVGGGSVEIVNKSNKGKSFKFTDVPVSINKITVDCKSKVISNDVGLNIYDKFNFEYLEMVRGDNILTVTGPCTLKFICDFPINVGG